MTLRALHQRFLLLLLTETPAAIPRMSNRFGAELVNIDRSVLAHPGEIFVAASTAALNQSNCEQTSRVRNRTIRYEAAPPEDTYEKTIPSPLRLSL